MNYISNDDRLNEIIDDFDNLVLRYKVEEHGIMFPDVLESEKILMLIYACGICHNMNWDYLCSNFMYKLKIYSKGFDTNILANIDEKIVEKFFDEYPKKHKVEAARRTEMIKGIAKDLSKIDIVNGVKSVARLEGQGGLFSSINSIEVFSEDPLHKKTNLLAQILMNDEIIIVEDEYNIEPMVDYHIIRLYLRTGRIKIVNKEIEEKIRKKEELSLEQITELRQMIAKQIQRVCSKYSKTANELNIVDWYTGRNICQKETANCKECPYNRCCDSSDKSANEMLIEPIDNHGFY
ncbi:MAG: hypothetical protein FWC79_01775 [Oscillospiraceae bacterium]|nr:hypothetical protein [Oscillospiraceae bacterium]